MSQNSNRSTHRLRLLLVVVLIICAAQGWFGDTTNLFVTTSSSSAIPFSAFFQAIVNHGPILLWHAIEGFVLLILSFITVGLSFTWSNKRSVRILSVLAALGIVSAVIGGVTFVLSGFSFAGSSAEMGGSFIGAFAFYFMELYFTK